MVDEASSGTRSLPLWQKTFGKFTDTLVGTDPYTAEGKAASTTIKAEIFPLVVTFENTGQVFDPTETDNTCSPAGSAMDLTLQSPVFQPTTIAPGGTDIGTGEYPTYLYQRANFYRQTASSKAINPDYGVTLHAVPEPPIDISVPAIDGEAEDVGCDGFGLINVGDFDPAGIISNLTSLIQPDVLPVFVLYNVGFFVNTDPNDCCVLAYSGAFDNPAHHGALQTYIVAEYDTSELFTGTADITNLSATIGDWMDNPMGQNQTRPWGNVGLIQSCQVGLEPGSPLSKTDFPLTMPNGYTYHPRELAFTSWFYRDRPSSGVNGWYSFNGTFSSPAAKCRK